MYGFHFTRRALSVGWIQDTQFGFEVRLPLRLQLSSLTPRIALHPARRTTISFQVRSPNQW